MGLSNLLDERKYSITIRNFIIILDVNNIAQYYNFRIRDNNFIYKNDDFNIYKEWSCKTSIKNDAFIDEFIE